MIASQFLNSLCHGASIARSALFDPRPPTAYVGGWLGKDNLGDEALFVAYQSLFPKINFLHFDGGRAARQIFSRVRSLSAGMLGGGTLIGEHPQWLEIPKTFAAIHSKFFVFGTGVEEPSFWKGKIGTFSRALPSSFSLLFWDVQSERSASRTTPTRWQSWSQSCLGRKRAARRDSSRPGSLWGEAFEQMP